MRTNAGADFEALVMGSPSSTGTGAAAPANYMAVTANPTAPAATDTTLTGEITTAGGGLLRKAATYAHTAGTTTYTLTATFTTNTNDAFPVTLQKMGILNAAVSGGTLVFETAINPTVTLSVAGDAVTITETVSM